MIKMRGLGIRSLIITAWLGVALAAAQEGQDPISVNVDFLPERLLVAPPFEDWPSYNGDYSGRRYSALDQINPDNVHRLRVQWLFHSTNSDSMEVTPVVTGGVMYITSGNDAFALDARTGRVLWHHARPLSQGLIDDAAAHHNRGVAVWHTRVYMETDNAHLLCLDARSGHLIWESPMPTPAGITAPRARL